MPRLRGAAAAAREAALRDELRIVERGVELIRVLGLLADAAEAGALERLAGLYARLQGSECDVEPQDDLM